MEIKEWLQFETNDRFQIIKYADPIIIHSDKQDWVSAYYLTPNARLNSGTSFYRDKQYLYRKLLF